MLAMALYGKYRPQNFANLVGQDHIRQTLLHEIQKNTLAHAYLFAGPRGTGKTSTARLIAKALNCEKKTPEGEPCDECDLCKSITEGSLIDVVEIDAASNRGIDEIRDLKEKIVFAPTRAKTKIYIIDEVHMLTKEAFNALLKTLEEPPESVCFILCTTEIHKIPETIISRCQRFDFRRIDVRTIMTRLSYIAQMEGLEVQDDAIELIAKHVEGGLRDAIGLLEQLKMDNKLSAERVREHLGIAGNATTQLLDILEQKDMIKAINLINQVHNEGYDLNSFVREILECLRDRLISGIQNGLQNNDILLNMIERFEEARDMLRNTVIPQLPLEIAAIKLCGQDGIVHEEVSKTTLTFAAKNAEKNAEESDAKSAEKNLEKSAEQEKKSEKSLKVESTVNAQANEEKTANILKNEYEMEAYKQGGIEKFWQNVLEKIQPPALRRSLADAKPGEGESGTLTLVFGSRFHMEKANASEAKIKVEKAISQIFGKTVKVDCALIEKPQTADAPRKLASTSEREKFKKAQEKSKSEETKKPANIAEKAMEIFGEF